MNPILKMLNQQNSSNNPQLQQLKQLFQSGGNPMNMIPSQLRPLLNSSGNYEQLFYQMCREKGINPQEILDYLRR